VPDLSWLLRLLQDGDSLEQDLALPVTITGFSQRLSKGVLNRQGARHADFFCPIGHIGNQQGGKTLRFKKPRQHGRVDGTVWSNGG